MYGHSHERAQGEAGQGEAAVSGELGVLPNEGETGTQDHPTTETEG